MAITAGQRRRDAWRGTRRPRFLLRARPPAYVTRAFTRAMAAGQRKTASHDREDQSIDGRPLRWIGERRVVLVRRKLDGRWRSRHKATIVSRGSASPLSMRVTGCGNNKGRICDDQFIRRTPLLRKAGSRLSSAPPTAPWARPCRPRRRVGAGINHAEVVLTFPSFLVANVLDVPVATEAPLMQAASPPAEETWVMRIDIITPAFNVAPYIGDAIRSVLAQTHRYWTMTIVDDGSTDETAAVAASFEDPRIRLLRQRNAGVSAARNLGLVASNAEAVLFLDADDWLSPDALSTLAAVLREAPNAIAAVGPYRRVPEGGSNRGSIRSSGGGRVWRPASGDLLKSLLVRNLFANGGHLLIRRYTVETAGTFDPGLSYGEDWEYWVRLARFGSFAAVHTRAPVLFVRERHDGACRGKAIRPESFVPCVDAIFNAPALKSRFSAEDLARLRQRAEAESDLVVGRELLRHGKVSEGRHYLRRSVVAAPSLKRITLLTAASLPMMRIGPFRSYPTPETVLNRRGGPVHGPTRYPVERSASP